MKAQDQKVKLTLSVKKSAIDRAKKYASLEGTSVSHIVEDYLAKYISTKDIDPENKTPNPADLLFGCAKDSALSKMTDREIRDLRIKEKYNV